MQKFDERFAIHDAQSEARRLQRRREILEGNIVDLAVVEDLFLLVVGDTLVTDDDLVDALFLPNTVDTMQACGLHDVHGTVAELGMFGEHLGKPSHPAVATDEEHSVHPDPFCHQVIPLDLPKKKPCERNVCRRGKPTGQDDEPRRKPVSFEEDCDDDNHDAERRGTEDHECLAPKGPRGANRVQSFDRVDNKEQWRHEQREPKE